MQHPSIYEGVFVVCMADDQRVPDVLTQDLGNLRDDVSRLCTHLAEVRAHLCATGLARWHSIAQAAISVAALASSLALHYRL